MRTTTALLSVCLALALLLALLLAPLPAHAWIDGMALNTGTDIMGQIKAVDLDSDGKKEMIFGGVDGHIHLYDSSGNEVRTGLWPVATTSAIYGSVAVGRIKDGGGDADLRISVGTEDGRVFTFDRNGKVVWTQSAGGPMGFTTPEMADLNGDGKLETIVASGSGVVSVFDEKGELQRRVNLEKPISAQPLVRRIDADPSLPPEIVVRDDRGFIHVLKGTSERLGFPVKIGNDAGTYPFGVTAADLTGDGNAELVAQTPYPWNLVGLGPDGREIFRHPLEGVTRPAARVVDVDRDGKPDLVIAGITPNQGGYVDVRGLGGHSLPGWPRKAGDYINGAPQVVDVNGDGRLDIVFTAWTDKPGVEGGFVTALDSDGNTLPGFPRNVGKSLAPPTIADIDGDGVMEIIVAGNIGSNGPKVFVGSVQAAPPIRVIVLGSRYDTE